jgi:hypothetical protein
VHCALAARFKHLHASDSAIAHQCVQRYQTGHHCESTRTLGMRIASTLVQGTECAGRCTSSRCTRTALKTRGDAAKMIPWLHLVAVCSHVYESVHDEKSAVCATFIPIDLACQQMFHLYRCPVVVGEWFVSSCRQLSNCLSSLHRWGVRWRRGAPMVARPAATMCSWRRSRQTKV